MVPLEKVLKRPSPEQGLAVVELERPPRAADSDAPPAPLQFKVVDVRSSRVLAEGVGAREAVDVLEDVDSVIDVRIYVWMRPAERWRLLTLAERRALWGFRRRAQAATAS